VAAWATLTRVQGPPSARPPSGSGQSTDPDTEISGISGGPADPGSGARTVLLAPAQAGEAASAERLAELWKVNGDSAFGDQVADAWIKAQAYRLHTFGTVTRLAGGGELGAESSVTKVFWSDLDVALHQTALEIRGADGELANTWTDGLLFALGGPIYAGTNEIQRNIIAERLLGLPREKSK